MKVIWFIILCMLLVILILQSYIQYQKSCDNNNKLTELQINTEKIAKQLEIDLK